jgi:hypothetical protein
MAFEVNRHMIRRLDVLQCSNCRITTPEHITGRAGFELDRKKNPGFLAEKIMPMPVPWDVSGLSFRAGLGADRPRILYCKRIKNHFGPGSGQKKFAGFKISTHARPPAQ